MYASDRLRFTFAQYFMIKMKYRLYVDEVGNSDLKSSDNTDHRFLSLTGVVFDLDYVGKALYPEVELLQRKLFLIL
jgi:hypothetical protein